MQKRVVFYILFSIDQTILLEFKALGIRNNVGKFESKIIKDANTECLGAIV